MEERSKSRPVAVADTDKIRTGAALKFISAMFQQTDRKLQSQERRRTPRWVSGPRGGQPCVCVCVVRVNQLSSVLVLCEFKSKSLFIPEAIHKHLSEHK